MSFWVLFRFVIDNAAHVGGLGMALLLGFWVFRKSERSLPLGDAPALRVVGFLGETGFVGLMVFTATKLLQAF